MSRILAKQKLCAAQDALRCAQANLEGAAEELERIDGDFLIYAQGLRIATDGTDQLIAAARSIVNDLDREGACSTRS